MKKYLKFIVLTFVLTFMIFEIAVLGIISIPKDVFHSSYQSVIQDKYRVLTETNEPKIIIVSGSSSSFGLDQDMLEEATGYKVANLGLHAGFGHLFYSELAKANINKGDIVLLGYEYDWYTEVGFDTVGTDLIMSGIDDNLEMYKYIPPRKWSKFIGYLFTYASSKNSFEPATGIYSREAFDDETGQMTMPRDYNIDYNEKDYGTVDLSDVSISKTSCEYLKSYKDFIKKQGASVYFIAPPLLDACVKNDYSDFDKLIKLEEEQIGIPYISNPKDYLFPADLISNSIYHCNSKGGKVRTELLIKDLKNASIIKQKITD